MSKSNAVLLAIAVIAIGSAAWYRQQVFKQEEKPAPPTSLHVAFVTGGSGPYWQSTANGAREAADDHKIKLDVAMPEQDESLEEQMTLLTKLKLAELDGVAVSPLSAEAQTSLLNRIQEQTNLITFDSDAPYSQRRGHVGTSNYGAGGLCAELVAEAIPDGGKTLVLMANRTKNNMIDRQAGFEDGLKRRSMAPDDEEPPPAIEVVGFVVDEGDSQTAADGIRTALERHQDLACIVGMNARHGGVIMKTLGELDQLGKIKVVAFDLDDPTLDGVSDGHIYATIAQDPYKYGYEAVRMLYSLAQKKSDELPITGGGTINISTEAVRKDNVDKFRRRVASRSAE